MIAIKLNDFKYDFSSLKQMKAKCSVGLLDKGKIGSTKAYLFHSGQQGRISSPNLDCFLSHSPSPWRVGFFFSVTASELYGTGNIFFITFSLYLLSRSKT